jgi:2-polyprenyl-6-methoxyphenol hydroxylase-like FAD-dependent oxidoreductase
MVADVGRRLRVGIVGGGVAGCAAGILLREAGHEVVLFEQSLSVGPVGAGVLLQPSGQRVLAGMGLLDRVVERAERIDELVAFTHRGGLLSQLRYADHSAGRAYGLHRGDLFGVLHEAMHSGGVDVRLHHTIARATSARNRATLIDTNDRHVGEFDLVVAADGSRSRIRGTSGLRAFEHLYQPAAWWAVGECADVKHQLLQRTRDTRQLCGLLPMGGGRCSFFWGTTRNDRRVCMRQPFGAWREDVRRLMPESASIVEKIAGYEQLMFATYRAVYMPRVASGRVVFIGDAAHASSPHLGQGINLALLDAQDLARAIEAHGSVADALNAYDRSQRWRNAWYSLATAGLTPTFQGSVSVLGHARDLALPGLQRVAVARRLMLATLTGVLR